MIWFKHMSDAANDELLRAIRSKWGWEGYGRWWAVVEAVAQQMDNYSDKCDLELSIKDWAALVDMRPKKLVEFLHDLASHKKSTMKMTIFDQNGNEINYQKLVVTWELPDSYRIATRQLIVFCIPKLLKLRDTRNSVRPQRGDRIEESKSKEKINKKEKKSARKKPVKKMPLEVTEALEKEKLPNENWINYARSKGIKVELFPIFESFYLHHKKKGSVFADWYAAWQTWVRNAEKWNPEYFKSPTRGSDFSEKRQVIKGATDDFMTWVCKKKRDRDEITEEWNKYVDYVNTIEYGAWLPLDKVFNYSAKKGMLNG